MKKLLLNNFINYIILILLLFKLNPNVFAQKFNKNYYQKKIDSLSLEIETLNKQIEIFKKNDFIKFYQAQKKLDQLLFIKEYYKSLYYEDFNNIENQLNQLKQKALIDNDKNTLEFCELYKNQLDLQIKLYHMHYQKLFSNTKNIEKILNPYINKNDKNKLYEAINIIDYSLKYAKNHNFKEIEKYLINKKNYIEGLIFDIDSPFNLKQCTESEKKFNKIFIKLLKSDSLQDLKKAQELVNHCIFYCQKIKRPLDTAYFNKQKNIVIATMSDYYDRQRYLNNDVKFFDQAIKARLDTLNKPGIYKWHDKIVIINEINFKYNSENLQKGEAIIAADKTLIYYLKKMKLIETNKNLKIAGTKFIPYKNGNDISFFRYNNESKKWQYMISYSIINNKKLTEEIIKYMPPMIFIEEENFK